MKDHSKGSMGGRQYSARPNRKDVAVKSEQHRINDQSDAHVQRITQSQYKDFAWRSERHRSKNTQPYEEAFAVQGRFGLRHAHGSGKREQSTFLHSEESCGQDSHGSPPFVRLQAIASSLQTRHTHM
eukprot:TRINITY_DN49084_c0_g1_i1.p2 TRINITY_DN49084_c0_g1~~TRINITY_DN49084_c0_g1_i1.p2  ORF type:complete len:127 (+),score=0.88 TRINITY_DN49084_c0_g1_i1:377-757(+)